MSIKDISLVYALFQKSFSKKKVTKGCPGKKDWLSQEPQGWDSLISSGRW